MLLRNLVNVTLMTTFQMKTKNNQIVKNCFLNYFDNGSEDAILKICMKTQQI